MYSMQANSSLRRHGQDRKLDVLLIPLDTSSRTALENARIQLPPSVSAAVMTSGERTGVIRWRVGWTWESRLQRVDVSETLERHPTKKVSLGARNPLFGGEPTLLGCLWFVA